MNTPGKNPASGSCGPGCCTTEATNEGVATFQPDIDVLETASEYVIHADVPGATAETLDINFNDGVLHVRAGVAARHATEARHHAREYGVGNYERSFRVSNEIDSQRISAELKQGVLTLHLPKSEAVKARKINVTSTN